MNKEKWYFTFCIDDVENANKYAVFEGSYEEAREQMFKAYGRHWAFQYSEEEFKGQVEQFGLIPIGG